MPASTRLRSPRRARLPQLEARTHLVAIAAALQVVEEAARWLGETLPPRYAAALAFRAKITFAHSASFRRGFARRADAGRERLYVYLRHWLAARLHADRPDLFRKLPVGYCTGEPLPGRTGNVGIPFSDASGRERERVVARPFAGARSYSLQAEAGCGGSDRLRVTPAEAVTLSNEARQLLAI